MDMNSIHHLKEFGHLSDSDIGTMVNVDPELQQDNEIGHAQKLQRNFSLLSVCSVGIVTGNTWAALGGTITIAIFNGGPPGVIYEFIAVWLFYCFIAASLAELASSMPSSAGVFYWASITAGPKYGRICGFFAGWWNFFAWNFACASMSSIVANITIAMYMIFNPEYEYHRWHTFIAYLVGTWACCGVVLFANNALPRINKLGLFFILAGAFITIAVCAIMPKVTGSGYAGSSFVWTEWSNQSGYTSEAFVFLAGMLNGAFAVGTPDCVSHLAEEIPDPERNIPLAVGAQMITGFLMAFFYLIAIFYAINSLDLVFNSPVSDIFPLAQIYLQATSSKAGCFGLLFVLLCPVLITLIGTYITAGRTFYGLARDEATPFPDTFKKVSQRFKNPFHATILCGCNATIIGAIYVGSTTAFNAFVGSFVVLSTLSYFAAILPFILTRRFSNNTESGSRTGNGMVPGPFQMGSVVGYVVNIVSCAYILVFVVIYCFPYSMPVSAGSMNYSCATVGGLSLFIAIWWLIRGSTNGRYIGPKTLMREGELREGSTELVGNANGR